MERLNPIKMHCVCVFFSNNSSKVEEEKHCFFNIKTIIYIGSTRKAVTQSNWLQRYY